LYDGVADGCSAWALSTGSSLLDYILLILYAHILLISFLDLIFGKLLAVRNLLHAPFIVRSKAKVNELSGYQRNKMWLLSFVRLQEGFNPVFALFLSQRVKLLNEFFKDV
jgi:hypothetical protein